MPLDRRALFTFVSSAPVAAGAILLLAWAGVARPTNLTLPWSELGRPRPADWETVTWAAALLGLAAMPHGLASPLVRSVGGRLGRALLLVAAVGGLAWAQLSPSKWTLSVIKPAPEGAVAAPFLGAGQPERVLWSRRLAEGNAVALTSDLLANEAALAGLAGGIHQAAAAEAVTRGERWGWVAGGQDLARRGLWALERGASTVTLWGRVALLGALPAVLLLVLFGRGAPRPLAWLVRAPVWAIPAANALSVVVTMLLWMPDDLDLRLQAAGIATTHLLAVGLAEAAGRPKAAA